MVDSNKIVPNCNSNWQKEDTNEIDYQTRLQTFHLDLTFDPKPVLNKCYVLTESEAITGNFLRLRPQCVDRAIGLRFPCNDRTDKVNKLFIIYGLFIMDPSLRSIKTNIWPANNFKKTPPQWVVCLSPQYSQVTLGSGCPFWHLSTDHNIYMSIKMSTIKLNRDCICSGHLGSNAWWLQENSQSEGTYYCSHIIARLSYRAYSPWRHSGHIGVPKQWNASHLVLQTNPVGVGLFSYVKYFFCSHKFA